MAEINVPPIEPDVINAIVWGTLLQFVDLVVDKAIRVAIRPVKFW